MIEDALRLGASRSSILRKLGLRARIDARAPNVSANGGSTTGMRRDPTTGFSEGWNEFFKFKGSEPRYPNTAAAPVKPSPAASSSGISAINVAGQDGLGGVAPAWAPGADKVIQGPHGSGFSTFKGSQAAGPSAEEMATTFSAIPNLTIQRGLPPGFETGVAQNYLSAAARNLRGGVTPQSEWDAKFKRRGY